MYLVFTISFGTENPFDLPQPFPILQNGLVGGLDLGLVVLGLFLLNDGLGNDLKHVLRVKSKKPQL